MDFALIDTERLLQLDMIIRVGLQVALLFASAFFSGSETALFSLSRLELQQLRRTRHPKFGVLQALLEQPRLLIISILTGNEIINVAAAVNMAGILVALFGAEIGGALNVLVMVPLLLLFGEITPKTIAISNPVKVSTQIIAMPLTLWVKLITPIRWVIRLISDRVTTWIIGEETAAENILRVDEFRALVDEVVKEGELSSSERSVIYNLLEAGTTEVIEIMIPRTKTEFIDANMSIKEIVKKVRTLQHMRIPVYKDSRDNLIGFIHAEDIMQLILHDKDLSQIHLHDILRPPEIVPPTKKIDEMFDFFMEHNVQAAAVLNEFGGIDGLVTLKTIVNFVFGKITPEAATQFVFNEISENEYEVAGDMKITTFNSLTNFNIYDSRMTTVAGLVLRTLDRLPKVDDEVSIEGVIFQVLEMKEHRITLLKVSKGKKAEE
jgi:CBS domain containing-hemolysin-like protein